MSVIVPPDRPGYRSPQRSLLSLMHHEEQEVAPLSPASLRRFTVIRLVGTMASVLIALGGLVGGAVMVENPVASVPLLNILVRAPFAAVGLCLMGSAVLVMSWLALLRYALPIRHYSRGESELTQMTRGQTWTVLAAWSLPLFFTAPMFSKDVYSYVAFGYAAHQGLDVYSGGPQDLLTSRPLADNVPLEWRHTPAQYGAGFVALARLIASITGDSVVAGIACYRFIALISLIVLALALRWIAHRCNMRAATALWLGVINPLTLFHMVAGVHNEAVMLTLTIVGLSLGLEGIQHPKTERTAWAYVVGGAFCIAMGATIKLPAAAALGFLGMAVARAWWSDIRGIPIMAAILAGVLSLTAAVMSALAGTGWTWLTSTGAAVQYPTVLTLSNNLATAMTTLTRFLGLGNHYEAFRSLSTTAGFLLALLFILWALWKVYMGQLHPIGGFGLSMLVTVLCFPVMHPWYLLWGVVALSGWMNDRRYRIPIVIICAIVAIWIMPQGGTMPASLSIFLVIETIVFLVIGVLIWQFYVHRRS